MACNTARDLTNEYDTSSIDDILTEYQIEQHTAAVEARFEAIMQAEPEEVPKMDDEGVKVYKPKKSSASVIKLHSDSYYSDNTYTDDTQQPLSYEQEQSEHYDEQGVPFYYDEQGVPFYYDEQGVPFYYDDQGNPFYYDEQGVPFYYDEQGNPFYYDDQGVPFYYDDQGNPFYYDEQGNPFYYDDQGVPFYYDEQGNPFYYDEQGNPFYYESGVAEVSEPSEEPMAFQEQEDCCLNESQSPVFCEEQLEAVEDDSDFIEPEAPAEAAYEADDAEKVSGEYNFLLDFDDSSINPLININGTRNNAIEYDGIKLDLSADRNYIPPAAPYCVPVTPDADSNAPEEDVRGKKRRRGLFGRKNKKKPLNAPPTPEELQDMQYSQFGDAPEGDEEYAPREDYSESSDEAYTDECTQNEAEASGQEIIIEDIPQEKLNEEPLGEDFDEEDFSYSDIPLEDEADYEEADVREKESPDKAAEKHLDFDEDDFPSFGEYVLGLITGLLYNMRSSASVSTTATMDDSDEDMGRELNPVAASKYYGSHIHSLKLRLRLSLGVLLIMFYISLGLPMTGMLRTLPVQAAVLMASQLCILLLGLDVVTGAFMNLARGRFGADSMAVLLCVLTSIDALSVSTGGFGRPHTPLCLLSSLSFAGVLLSSLLSAKGFRKSMRVPAIAKSSYAVTGESEVKGSGLTLLKSVRSLKGFIRRSEESAPDETCFIKLSPLLLAAAVVLALIVCAVKKSFGCYLYVLTAILTPAVPVGALLCFALPFFIGSARIFSSGAAIAGWSGLCDIGSSKNLIVTDRDLFPSDCVEFKRIIIIKDVDEKKVISYAGTMINASGSCPSVCFAQLMKKNGCAMKKVENFEYLAGGGMKGVIDGDVVICGSNALMNLMGISVQKEYVEEPSVLLAINGLLCGIFNMKYTANPKVRKALVALMRSNRHPIFAVRDFNISPQMLKESFDVATDGYDFPPYTERFSISEATPGEGSKIAAVVCREGLGPLTHMADTGRSMYMATKINIAFCLLTVLVGMAAVFIKLVSAGAAGVGFMLGWSLLLVLPIVILSFILKF